MTRFLLMAAVGMLALGCSATRPPEPTAILPVEPDSSSWRDADGGIHIQGQVVTPVRERR